MYFVIVAQNYGFLVRNEEFCCCCCKFSVCDFSDMKMCMRIFQLDNFIYFIQAKIQNCNLIGMHFKSQQVDYP